MNNLFFAALTILLFALPTFAADTTQPADPANLRTMLLKSHPRIILTADRLKALPDEIKADPAEQKAFDALKSRGESILKSEPVKYEIIGPRLLTQSRKCFNNVTTLALLYRLTNDKKYLDRAILEMTTAAAFKDWNPSHFLDTAEMTCALGLGYDWLYSDLTPEQRTTIRTAIITHGLTPGLNSYSGKENYGWWTKAAHNWSQVCNGGLAVGLAIADEEPDLATTIITSGLKACRGAFAHWDADGGWDEGPGYWGYTTQYTSYYLSALQSATGSTFGLAETPGLSNAGYFRLYYIGPTGRTFNFADAGDKAGSDPQMFFFSHLYDHPEFAWQHRQEKLDSPFDLIWYDARGTDPTAMKLPTDKLFHGCNVLFLRSAWDDPKATWIGIKGGDNGANHSHLDLGSFVLDALGKRWASDLGSDDYNMPGYFGAQRWTYYRLKTEGHNTLLLDGDNQPAKAKADIIDFQDRSDGAGAIIDLTAAYPGTKRVQRGVAMFKTEDMSTILIQDEMEAAEPTTFVSAVHTAAAVTLAADARSATLKIDNQQMFLSLVGDAAAKLTTTPVKLDPPQEKLEGITRIQVEFPTKVATASIGLIFSPVQHDWPKLEPLGKQPATKNK